MNKKIVHLVMFLGILIFASCLATKAGYYNLFGKTEYQNIAVIEGKPPKSQRYAVLGSVKLENYITLGTAGVDCPHYTNKNGVEAPLNQEVINELKVDAYDRWGNNVTALINMKCFTATITADVCECRTKDGYVSGGSVFPKDSFEKRQQTCQCKIGKLIWRNDKACYPALNCSATAVSYKK